MITVAQLTKSYGRTKALDKVSFDVPDGKVTGFLGPNGAGKTTLMRIAVGLERADDGTVLVEGRPLCQSASPLSVAGALLDSGWAHPRRSAETHLRTIALTHGVPRTRVTEVLEITGLSSVAGRKVGEFSLGMRQRLGIAAALLGNPRNLLLDEPVNGLDPDGVVWIRNLVRHVASSGTAVLLSSHLISEMSQTADRVVVIGRGRVLAESDIADLLVRAQPSVLVGSADTAQLAAGIRDHGGFYEAVGENYLSVSGLSALAIGQMAAHRGLVIFHLQPQQASLEQVFMEMTAQSIDYQAEHVPVVTR